MSHLRLNGLRVRARVGCKDSERAHPQMLSFDLLIYYDMRAAIASDDVAQAIDYKGVAAGIRELLAAGEWHLLEKLAHDVGLCVRGLSERVQRVEVSATKDVITDVAAVTAVVIVDG